MDKKYKLLIIGGSGFLSGTLASAAVSQGHDVYVLTRGQKPVPGGVTALVADRHDEAAFSKAVAEAAFHWDAVFDCICFTPEEARQDVWEFKNRADHLVMVSTDFVYDPGNRWFPQTEANMNFLTDESYGARKRLCELEFINGDTGNMVYTVLRPAHIYGPGSYLGCLPEEVRNPGLISKIMEGEPLPLVGGGYFLQQPIFAEDLAELMLSCIGNERTYNEIFCTMGPDIIESRKYYKIIAEYLGREAVIEEIPVNQFLAEHPDAMSFMCHRIYDLSKLKNAGVKVPSTKIRDGIHKTVESLLNTTDY
ncbi:MAG: NAD-dependent epimerase/dehydratase family protein [Clostridia bacterium]|nr:NAD-dependent epimerase/dehydratase family protein [Clostridia bacterium]